MRLIWLPSAADDLEEIHDYLLHHHANLVQHTMTEIYRSVQSLKQTPFRGRLGREEGIRELVLARLPYVIFYRINDPTIEILYIRHGARDTRQGILG